MKKTKVKDSRKSKIIKTVRKQKNLKDGRSKFDILKLFKNFKFKFKKQSTLIVADMELISGDIELFVVQVIENHFYIAGKRYVVHEKYLKYNRTIKMWVSKYHEGISLPVNQTIPAKELKDAVETSQNKEVQDIVNNIDPMILSNFVKTQIIQKVFAGEEMQNVFGFLKIMMILILVGVVIAVAILLAGVI